MYLGTAQSHGFKIENASYKLRDRRVHFFADESSNPEIVTCAFLLFDESRLVDIEHDWRQILIKYGAVAGKGFHARKIFHPHQRKKEPWMDKMNYDDAIALTSELSTVLKQSNPIIFLTLLHRSTFPQSTPDGSGREMKVTEAILFALAYTSAMSAIKQGGILELPIQKFLWMDQADSVKLWGVGNIQIKRLVQSFGLAPQPLAVNNKPLILEAADLVAYTAAKTVNLTDPRSKQFSPILRKLNFHLTHYWWNTEDHLNEKITERMNQCSFIMRDRE